MAYPQVIIPPSVKPVSPLELAPADDRTTPFTPAFARGTTQRQTWGDPIWSAQVRFEGMSGADRALLKAAIMGARGGAANILMTPGIPLRGSFPATEMLTNNDFSNGTTGWTADGNSASATGAVADRVLRVKASGYNAYIEHYRTSSPSATQYAPYVGRAFFSYSNIEGAGTTCGIFLSSLSSSNYTAGLGMKSHSGVCASTTENAIAVMLNAGIKAGDFYDSPYTSLSRCILADAGPNAMTYSDQIDNAAWTKTAATVTANATPAPDGTTTGDEITPNTSSTQHHVSQAATVSSSAADYCFYGCFKSNGYTFIRLEMEESTTPSLAYQMFNLGTGAVATSTGTGAGWSNLRSFITSLGNSWYACAIVARKTTASTSITARAFVYNSDSTSNYAGDGSSGARAWRLGMAQSSVPSRGAQTTSTALASGTSQTGTTLYVKGLPVSTSGLLLSGDFVEINGELMQVTASLDSDAAGLGVLQIHRRPTTAIADNTPIIVNNPFGTFRLAGDPRITERFGVYTDVDLQLIEALP